MIPKECKRLAEVDFPVADVSRHSAIGGHFPTIFDSEAGREGRRRRRVAVHRPPFKVAIKIPLHKCPVVR